MKNGGQIPWNAVLVCKTFKISCLMGRCLVKDVLGNHLKDRKTSHESINFERKSYLDWSSDTRCTRGEFGSDVLVADIEELETTDASEIYSKRLSAKEVIFPQNGNSFSSRRWTNPT